MTGRIKVKPVVSKPASKLPLLSFGGEMAVALHTTCCLAAAQETLRMLPKPIFVKAASGVTHHR